MEERGAEQRSLFRRWPAGRLGRRRRGGRPPRRADRLVARLALARAAARRHLDRAARRRCTSCCARPASGGRRSSPATRTHLAQHFARGVPPIALWNGIEVREDDPRLLADAAGWVTVRTVDEVRHRRPHVLRRRAADGRGRRGRDVARLRAPGVRRAVIGRGRLRPGRRDRRLRAGVGRGARAVHRRGRRPLQRDGDARHDGDELDRSGRRYMAEELALPGTPEEINAAIVERMLARYGEAPPLIDGRRRGGALDRRARVPVAIASSSNPELIDVVLRVGGSRRRRARAVSSEEVARGKPAPDVYLEAARRLGVDPARCGGGRGLAQRHPLGEGGGDARRSRCRTRTTRPATRRSRSPTSCSRRSAS